MKTFATCVIFTMFFGFLGSAGKRASKEKFADHCESLAGLFVLADFIAVVLWIWGIAP